MRTDLLVPTEHVTHCPYKGDASYWTVRVGGEVIAESRRPTVLFETGLPTRFYLPQDGVRMQRLHRSGTQTSCP